MTYGDYYYQAELYHHGIVGQKWGVRRFQNPDGTRTTEGKRRAREQYQESSGNDRVSRGKKVVAGMAITATVAAAAAVYAQNPDAVNAFVARTSRQSVNAMKNGSKKAIEKGKAYVTEAVKLSIEGAREGLKEGLKEAPKRAVKTVMTGAALYAAKKILDDTVGKQESARIFTAANPKKVSSFWKVQEDDKDED